MQNFEYVFIFFIPAQLCCYAYICRTLRFVKNLQLINWTQKKEFAHQKDLLNEELKP